MLNADFGMRNGKISDQWLVHPPHKACFGRRAEDGQMAACGELVEPCHAVVKSGRRKVEWI